MIRADQAQLALEHDEPGHLDGPVLLPPTAQVVAGGRVAEPGERPPRRDRLAEAFPRIVVLDRFEDRPVVVDLPRCGMELESSGEGLGGIVRVESEHGERGLCRI
jgi:hypothetical protein